MEINDMNGFEKLFITLSIVYAIEHAQRLRLFAKATGEVSEILQGRRRLKMLNVRCDLEAKVDCEVSQPNGDNSTPDELRPAPYKIREDEPA
ncbi:hypothetical protein EVAR_95246_1 [Eumeta japonica]|uniref:Uncharacterized protein n=1 Tax=Eumeta variegata TaxID=151549 RepID=A0A4C1UJY1_EUMVA|nr:hypothetical protein EVAR_95246_1 [Eumeta japonica]